MTHRSGNKLVIGSTQSGKSWSEVPALCDAAEAGIGICVLDPHEKSLALNTVGHLIAAGHKKRIIWDNLGELERTPKFRFLSRSHSKTPIVRLKEHHQQAEQFGELLTRRRDQQSLATSPQTEEWVLKATLLLLNQPHSYPASDLRFALQPGHPKFERLLRECTDPDVTFEFERVSSREIKPGQYVAARRLIEGVCGSPTFIVRCGTSFDLGSFLDDGGILLIEGGNVSQPVLQTILGSICMQVIQHVRTRSRKGRILLVLDEAVNANLVGAAGHEVRALAECQKMGLDMHILVQAPTFPNSQIANDVFTNCKRHEWFYTASAAGEKKGLDDLGDPELSPPLRRLKVRERWVKDCDEVYHDFAPLLETPWIYPELTELKVRRAIEEIRHRREFGDTVCPITIGSSETEASSSSQPDTSVPPVTSSDSSPAKRRRTGVSKNSETKNSSDSSEQ